MAPLPLPLLPLLSLLLLPLASCQQAGLQCPSLDGSIVCRLANAGFEYNDGCNTIRCGPNGQIASTTLMLCEAPSSVEEDTSCSQQQQQVYSRLLNSVACPQLQAAGVCAAAPADFHFTDGCNFFTCDGRGGVGSSTMMSCERERPLSMSQREACSTLMEAVVVQLPARRCDINATVVCVAKGDGFHFSDGCNGITCQADGDYMTTMKMCDPAPNSSVVCQQALASVQRPAEPQQQFTCPKLLPATVCNQDTIGFSYSDGCNQVQCSRPGEAISTMRFCPEATPANQRSQEYCAKIVRQKDDKYKISSKHVECLQPEEACATGTTTYYNGCQYCLCTSRSAATCVGAACPTFFGTDEEFQRECKLRKAGGLF